MDDETGSGSGSGATLCNSRLQLSRFTPLSLTRVANGGAVLRSALVLVGETETEAETEGGTKRSHTHTHTHTQTPADKSDR